MREIGARHWPLLFWTSRALADLRFGLVGCVCSLLLCLCFHSVTREAPASGPVAPPAAAAAAAVTAVVGDGARCCGCRRQRVVMAGGSNASSCCCCWGGGGLTGRRARVCAYLRMSE
jgi:hypothetical protein